MSLFRSPQRGTSNNFNSHRNQRKQSTLQAQSNTNQIKQNSTRRKTVNYVKDQNQRPKHKSPQSNKIAFHGQQQRQNPILGISPKTRGQVVERPRLNKKDTRRDAIERAVMEEVEKEVPLRGPSQFETDDFRLSFCNDYMT